MQEFDQASAVQYYSQNYLDASKLVWSADNGVYTMPISAEQWSIIHSVDKNMFLDDGQGFIDLGLDELFEYKNGVLTADMEKTWIAVNNQLVAYYHTDTLKDSETGEYIYYGYIPALLNGERVRLQVVFDANSKGSIIGATADYVGNETDTVAKGVGASDPDAKELGIQSGDKIDFLCDYYNYNGEYQDSYKLGEQLTVSGRLTVSDVVITDQKATITYRFTDMYNKEYWTNPVVK